MGVGSSGIRRVNVGHAQRRAAIGFAAAAAGLAVGIGAGASWSIDVLAAWDAAALSFLALVWSTCVRKDADETARLARDEDDSHRTSEALLLAASAASLVAVGFTLSEAGHTQHAARAGLTILAVGSVALAWACVHTVYALRYARLYYTPPIGGIDFAGESRPDYVDLAYLSFTIGMTFQVSDTELSKKGIRRAAIHHALLSYLFGAVILAIAINTVASLLGR
jgi:uncharacterized membrane protein